MLRLSLILLSISAGIVGVAREGGNGDSNLTVQLEQPAALRVSSAARDTSVAMAPAGTRDLGPLPFYYDIYTFRGPPGKTTVVAAYAVQVRHLDHEEARDGVRYRFDVTLVLADTSTGIVERRDDSVFVSVSRELPGDHVLDIHRDAGATVAAHVPARDHVGCDAARRRAGVWVVFSDPGLQRRCVDAERRRTRTARFDDRLAATRTHACAVADDAVPRQQLRCLLRDLQPAIRHAVFHGDRDRERGRRAGELRLQTGHDPLRGRVGRAQRCGRERAATRGDGVAQRPVPDHGDGRQPDHPRVGVTLTLLRGQPGPAQHHTDACVATRGVAARGPAVA